MHRLFFLRQTILRDRKFLLDLYLFIIYQLQTKKPEHHPGSLPAADRLIFRQFHPGSKNRQQRRQLIKRQQKCENRKNKPDKSQNSTCNKVKQSKHPESCAVGSAAEVCIIAERIDIVMYTSHILCFFTPALITCTTAENNTSEKDQCKFLPAKGSFF